MFLTEEWRSSHAILCCVVKILLFYHPLSVSMCLLLSVSRSQTWPNKAVRLMPPGSFQSFVWKHYSFFVSNGTTDWVIESKYSKSKDHNQNRIKRYMNCYTPSFWLIKANFQPIRRTGQIWVVTHYQHGISAFIPADLPTPRPNANLECLKGSPQKPRDWDLKPGALQIICQIKPKKWRLFLS